MRPLTLRSPLPVALLVALLVVPAIGGCEAPPAWTAPVEKLDRIVLSAFGTGPRDVWFAGGGLGSGPPGLAMHFDGAAFTDLPTGTTATLWWVFGLGPKDVWFCGEQGTILHWDGSAFTPSKSGTTETLYGLWGSSGSDLWAVGGKPNNPGVMLHFDGSAWSPAIGLPPPAGAYFKVWGSARDDVFVVGDGGAILHFDGSAWTAQPSGVDRSITLFTVAGRARDDVYAVGGRGTGVALHYDGKAWAPVPGLVTDDVNGLAGVAVSPVGDVAIGGFAGAKIRGRAAAWQNDSKSAPRDADFHGAWLSGPEDIFLVGGNFNAPAGVPRIGTIAHYGAALPTARR
ncbi:MAG: hypothetical protein EXR72_00085 [Myxococcales bacterium]|nr:hypothetical protein [Myxococcales bacterium]